MEVRDVVSLRCREYFEPTAVSTHSVTELSDVRYSPWPADVHHYPFPDFSARGECRKPWFGPRKRFRTKETVILQVHCIQMLEINSVVVEITDLA